MVEIVSKEEREGDDGYEAEIEYHENVQSTINVPSKDEVQRKADKAEAEIRWNPDNSQTSEREDMEDEAEYYRKTHPERSVRDKTYVAKEKVKTASKNAAEKVKTSITNAATAGWGNLKKNLSKPVQRADAIREKNAQGTGNLTKADVAKMIRAGKAKPTKGQFTSPKYSGGFGGGGKVSGTFPDIDPFGGMGGRGRNMLDIGFGSMGQAPQRQQPQQQRQAPPRPKPAPMKFPDPFAGLKTGRKDMPEKIMGKGLGIGSGPKSAKKLKRMDDWMNF